MILQNITGGFLYYFCVKITASRSLKGVPVRIFYYLFIILSLKINIHLETHSLLS